MVLLRRCVIRVTPCSVVGHIEDRTDFRYGAANRRFNALPQRLSCLAATLASATHANKDVVVADIDQLHHSTM